MTDPDATLPHSGVACLITDVLLQDPTAVTAAARVVARHPLVRDGRAPSSLVIEAAAQAAALHGAHSEARAREGYLVAVSRCALHATTLPADESFEVRVEHIRTAGTLDRWRFRAHRGGDSLADGELSVWRNG